MLSNTNGGAELAECPSPKKGQFGLGSLLPKF